MNPLRFTVGTACILLAASCVWDAQEGESGIDRFKYLELTNEAERKKLCTWSASALEKGDQECILGVPGHLRDDAELCVKDLPAYSCGAQVADFEQCILRIATTCSKSVLNDDDCFELRPCLGNIPTR